MKLILLYFLAPVMILFAHVFGSQGELHEALALPAPHDNSIRPLPFRMLLDIIIHVQNTSNNSSLALVYLASVESFLTRLFRPLESSLGSFLRLVPRELPPFGR